MAGALESSEQAIGPLDREFQYYSEILPNLVQSTRTNVENIKSWIYKLTKPIYNVEKLKPKRNRYLMMLSISLLNENVQYDDVFQRPPPSDLLDIDAVLIPNVPKAQWEVDTVWQEMESSVPDTLRERRTRICAVHGHGGCPVANDVEQTLGHTMDEQFQLFLHIARPQVGQLPQSIHRQKAARWLQTLGGINREACVRAKGIRNDYMMSLCGYLSNRLLLGPFQAFPTEVLPALSVAARNCAEKRPITDPTHPQIDQMILDMPKPEEGAFAFIAITGDLYD